MNEDTLLRLAREAEQAYGEAVAGRWRRNRPDWLSNVSAEQAAEDVQPWQVLEG